MKNWINVDKIFVGRAFGAANTQDNIITKDLLNSLDCPIDSFVMCVQKPCDNIELLKEESPLLYVEQLEFNQDGTMVRNILYSRYPKDVIRTQTNGHPGLTPWGQSIFDNAINEIEYEKQLKALKW